MIPSTWRSISNSFGSERCSSPWSSCDTKWIDGDVLAGPDHCAHRDRVADKQRRLAAVPPGRGKCVIEDDRLAAQVLDPEPSGGDVRHVDGVVPRRLGARRAVRHGQLRSCWRPRRRRPGQDRCGDGGTNVHATTMNEQLGTHSRPGRVTDRWISASADRWISRPRRRACGRGPFHPEYAAARGHTITRVPKRSDAA